MSVCVGPVRKPDCWFSHEAAHFMGLFQVIQVAEYDSHLGPVGKSVQDSQI